MSHRLPAAMMLTAALAFLWAGEGRAQSVRLAPLFDYDLVGQPSSSPPGGFSLERETEKKGTGGWFASPLMMYVAIDLTPLDPMTADRDLESFGPGFMLYGLMAGGIRKHWRFGGMFLTGYQRDTGMFNNNLHTAAIAFDGFGAFVEYNREHLSERDRKYPTRIPYLREGWQVGCMVGGGELNLRATGGDLGYLEEGRWSVSESIVVINPYAGIWLSPYDWIWVQLDLGYAMTGLDTEGAEYETNSGLRMADDNLSGGLQIGLKLIFGENQNIKQ